jgi:hypothetical protein
MTNTALGFYSDELSACQTANRFFKFGFTTSHGPWTAAPALAKIAAVAQI